VAANSEFFTAEGITGRYRDSRLSSVGRAPDL
jgi:hypothetical protein